MKNPATVEERLQKLEHLSTDNGVEINVIKRAVWSLITTHSDPMAFAKQFRDITERTMATHLNDELVTDAVREASHQYAMEMVRLAQDEHARRLGTRQQG